MKTETITHLTIIFEYNRDKDRDAPNKINRLKEVFDINSQLAVLKICFTLGINSSADTCAEFSVYTKDWFQILKEAKNIIGKQFFYIKDNKLYKSQLQYS